MGEINKKKNGMGEINIKERRNGRDK